MTKLVERCVFIIFGSLTPFLKFTKAKWLATKIKEIQCFDPFINLPPPGPIKMTSGGTESIILACLSARNLARVRRGIVRPVVVVPETAHAAFDKVAAQ